MPSVGEHSGYTLDELAEAVDLPWRAFAAWADARLPAPVEHLANPTLGEFTHGFHSPCGIAFMAPDANEYADWWELALHVLIRGLTMVGVHNVWGAIDAATGLELKSFPGKSRLYHKAIYRKRHELDSELKSLITELSRKERMTREFQEHSLDPRPEYLSYLRWARWALRGELNHERAFWNLVREDVQSELPALLDIRRRVRQGQPLLDELHDKLIEYTCLGDVRPVTWIGERGAVSVEVILEPSWYATGMSSN